MYKTNLKKLIGVLLTVCMLLGVFGVAAYAGDKREIVTQTVSYVDADGETQTVDAGLPVPGGAAYGAAGETNWYCLSGEYSGEDVITFNDSVVNIIIADDAEWTITNTGTFNVIAYNGPINFYGQSAGSGKLTLSSRVYSDKGDVTINGGSITTQGIIAGSMSDKAITVNGGSVVTDRLNCADLTVSGGSVTNKEYTSGGSVEISGGVYNGNGTSGSMSLQSGTVTISGGEVHTTGQFAVSATSGALTISGGKVTADGNTMGLAGKSVVISGGEVSATGSVYGIYASGADGTVEITGGNVYVSGSVYGLYPDNTDAVVKLGCSGPDDTITFDSDIPERSVSVCEGQTLTDGFNEYTGELTSDEIGMLGYKTLSLVVPVVHNWVVVPTSTEGLVRGDLYLDIESALNGYILMWTNQYLYDLIPANNQYVAGEEYMKKTYPELWAQAYGQVIESEHLSESSLGMTFEEYFSPEKFGGVWRYDAEDIFFDALADMGVDVSYEALSAVGADYVQTAYSDECAQAQSLAQAKADEIRSCVWYFDFTNGIEVMTTLNGESYDVGELRYSALDSLSEYGADWRPVRIVDSVDELDNGDYYIERSAIVAVFTDEFYEMTGGEDTYVTYDFFTGDQVVVTLDDYLAEKFERFGDYFVNHGAADTSLFRYRIDITYESYYSEGESMVYETYLPLSDGYIEEGGGILGTAFLDANVKFWHPEHVGDWAPDENDASKHSRICGICGETETVDHVWVWTIDVAPTCVDGKRHQVCVCGAAQAFDSAIEATQPHDFDESIEANVTVQPATCLVDGKKTVKCSRCDATSETVLSAPGSHDTELKGAKDATATEDGYTGDEVCKVCGETIKTGTVIPATGAPDSPEQPPKPSTHGGPIHAIDCFCWKYQGSGIIQIILNLICGVYNQILLMTR